MAHSSYLSTYRLDGYAPKLYLSVYTPLVACSGTLTATPSNPTTTLAVSFAVGSALDVQQGFLIRIRDTASGKVKGYTRVRYTGTPTSSSIPVRELAFAHVACASGDTFEVLRYVPMDTKLTTADATFSPDGIPYSSQGSDPPPLICSGGNSVGWVDSGQTYRTIHTDGSNTSLVDPDSSSPPAHYWVNDSGTAFAGGSADSDESPVIRANAGSWLIRHNGVDADNLAGATQWTHHVVHDSTHLPYECVLTDYSGDHENGVSWSVEVLDEDVTSEDIFDLALCFLWTDDYLNSSVTDLHRSEVTGRSHIIGMGYARRVTSSMSGDDGVEHLTFDIQSPLARLQEIASYSKVMLENASPDDWNDVKTLGFWRGEVQLSQFYTTLTEAGYDKVRHSSYVDARYPAHFLQRSDPIAQMRELIDARQGRLVQREWGARFETQYHPAWLPLDERTSTDITLTDEDAYEFEWSNEMADSIEMFQMEGIIAGATGNQSFFSRIGVGGGKSQDTMPRKSPDTVVMGNDWAGMVYASRENVFQDEDGIRYRVGELTLRCPGQYMVLDFSPDYVRFTYDGRYVDFSAFRFWLKRFVWDVDAETGEAITTFTFQCETAAREGVTFVPDSGVTTPGDGQPPAYPFPPTVPDNSPFPPYDGVLPVNGIVYSSVSGKFCRITALNGGALVFGADFSGIGNTKFYGGYSNPWNYRQTFGFGDVRLETSTDISTNTAFTSLQSNASLFGGAYIGHRARGSIHRSGYGAIVSGSNYFRYTFDNWATLQTAVSINGLSLAPAAAVANNSCDFCLCGHNAGHIYAVAPSTAGSGTAGLFKSTNYGATWTQVMTFPQPYTSTGRIWLDIPYTRADGTPNVDNASIEMYYYEAGVVGPVSYMSRIVGTTITLTVFSSANGSPGAAAANYNPMSSFTYGLGYYYLVDNHHIRRTTDNFSSISANLMNATGNYVSVNGWSSNPNPAIAWGNGANGYVWVTFDGTTWIYGLPSGWANGIAYAEFSLYPFQ